MKTLFTIVCGLLMVMLSMIRSGPVYGKLDFILIDSKNWWHEMQPIFKEGLSDGNQPILTDHMTGFIFDKCFGHKLLEVTQFKKQSHLSIASMEIVNRPFSERASLQAIYATLLIPETGTKKAQKDHEWMENEPVLPEFAPDQNITENKPDRPERPYRCVINLKGFTSTWVPKETGHWSEMGAHTSWYYYLPDDASDQDIAGYKKLVDHLNKAPLKNCRVYH